LLRRSLITFKGRFKLKNYKLPHISTYLKIYTVKKYTRSHERVLAKEKWIIQRYATKC
jgi:hypothetical protein